MTPEELSRHTHDGMMNHALSSVAAIFEGDGWSACDALRAANGLMEPAFRAWGELMDRVMADDKRIRELEAQLAEARRDGARLDFLIKHCRCGRGQLDRYPRSFIDEAMNKRCGSCGKPMAGFKGNKIYCSVRCANRISKRMQREREKRNLNDRQTQDNKCIG